jgi:hypothetical protein
MRKSAYASAALGPIVPIWSEHAHIPALKHHLAAIAVVFESVTPVLALWRLIDRGSELGRNKAKGHGGHATNLAWPLEIASQVEATMRLMFYKALIALIVIATSLVNAL